MLDTDDKTYDSLYMKAANIMNLEYEVDWSCSYEELLPIPDSFIEDDELWYEVEECLYEQ